MTAVSTMRNLNVFSRIGSSRAFVGPTVRQKPACKRATSVTTSAMEVATLALTGEQAGVIAAVLKPSLTIFELFFIMRIVMSWDPKFDTDKTLPWKVFYIPTEPILGPTRKAIQPIGGVDVSPIVWTFLLSLLNEILLGPQGILILIERQGGL